MRKQIDRAGYKWILSDETPTKEEAREFIAETNRLYDGFLRKKK
jgi:hypothetical protein